MRSFAGRAVASLAVLAGLAGLDLGPRAEAAYMSVGSGLTPDVTGGGLYLASEPADLAPAPEKEFPLPHTPRATPDLLECLNSTGGMSGSPPTPPSASAAAPVAVLSAAVLWPPARSNYRWVLRNMGTPRSTPSSVFEPPRTLLLP